MLNNEEEVCNMADENNYQYNTPLQGQQPPQQNDQNYNPFNGSMPPMPPQEEKASVGLAILSYLIPLVGLILYLTKKDSRPKTAKACGKCALASVIINIVLTIILYAVMGGALLSGLSDETAVDSSYAESYDDELAAESGSDSGNTSDNTVGDYTCVVKGAEVCKDWADKDAVLITYEFTNNSDSAISFDVALDAKAYQDGIGLESTFLDDDTDIVDVEIKPGVTKEVKKAYVLRDTSTEIEIEISELISFSDDKIITKVTL